MIYILRSDMMVREEGIKYMENYLIPWKPLYLKKGPYHSQVEQVIRTKADREKLSMSMLPNIPLWSWCTAPYVFSVMLRLYANRCCPATR